MGMRGADGPLTSVTPAERGKHGIISLPHATPRSIRAADTDLADATAGVHARLARHWSMSARMDVRQTRKADPRFLGRRING